MSRQKASHVDSAAAVGARVRALRLEHGLLQRDLAFDGCTAAYISRIEAGARVPSLQLLRQLGARLGVSADYLATGTEDIGSTAELALADAQLADPQQRHRDHREDAERDRWSGSPRSCGDRTS